jgi:hypothetical protein
MKSIKHVAIYAITVLSTLTLAIESSATPVPDRQSGEIFQEQDADQQDSYSATQDQVIEYFKGLRATMRSAANGASTAKLAPLSENALTYLNSAYLYCSVNNATCPEILDAILEIEVINGRLSSKAECPNLKQFWRLWIKNQMEERHNFAVKTAFLNPTNDFKRTRRPRYIKCDATVAAEFEDQGSATDYFKKRYISGSEQLLAVDRTVKMLEQIRAEVPDLFTAVKTD